jgi:hypothetical protein
MQIRRGPDGKGVNAVSCSTCHQDHNLAGLHMPPGAPDWSRPLQYSSATTLPAAAHSRGRHPAPTNLPAD